MEWLRIDRPIPQRIEPIWSDRYQDVAAIFSIFIRSDCEGGREKTKAQSNTAEPTEEIPSGYFRVTSEFPGFFQRPFSSGMTARWRTYCDVILSIDSWMGSMRLFY